LLFSNYELKNIWNGNKTGLFWKIEPTRVLACSWLSGHKKENQVKELLEYNVYNAILNATEAWSMIKTGILPPHEIVNRYDIFVNIEYRELDELENLLTKLLGDDNLSAFEYISIKENEVESELTDDEILAAVAENKEEIVSEVCKTNILEKVGCSKAEKAINTILRFLYEQKDGFGEIEDDAKVLRRLHKRVRVLYVKNLKQ
ncbi:14325_t:CDS:2, partial [Racocetra persica]